MTTPDPAKQAAAVACANLVDKGMRVGLGSGSTFLLALEHLARRQQDEGLDFVGVPTSEGTANRARQLGIALSSLDELPELDIAIDGADEIDPAKHMIKGGGAALVREKIVAAAAREMVIMVGENKCVPILGKAFRLPVEVLAFGAHQAAQRLAALGCSPQLRRLDGQPLVTDNGNQILDCHFADGIADPPGLEAAINLIPGVLDNGLFVGMAGRVMVGQDDGSVREIS